MSVIPDEPWVRWTARVIIIATIIGIVWLIVRKKSFNYDGLQNYQAKNFMLQFLPTLKKKRGRRVWGKTEEMCRQIIQDIYKRPFPSVRPPFLRNPHTKKNLELDCYNSDLRVALEYNGKQHYSYVPAFHKSKRDFYSQVHRDDWKRKKCRQMGIRLIEIPYWITPINLRPYITAELRKKGAL